MHVNTILEISVDSRQSAQALGVPRKLEKTLLTQWASTIFSTFRAAPISCTAFSRSTAVSRKKGGSVLAICLALTACSSSNVIAPKPQEAASDGSSGSLSGYILGPRVAGLGVGSNTTSISGSFNYSAGEILSFHLGNQPLASMRGRSQLSLYDLAGAAAQYRHNKGVRLGQLLLSLDSDGQLDNGVQLPELQIGSDELNWQASATQWEAQAQSLVYRLSNGSSALVDEQLARQTLAAHLRDENERCEEEIETTEGFNISDPRCSDRARMHLWRNNLAENLPQLQNDLEDMLDQRMSLDDWWQRTQSQWRILLGNTPQSQAWISYVLAGADVPTRTAISHALAEGSGLTVSLRAELQRWRDGGAGALRQRDKRERELMIDAVTAWFSFGFDQSTLRSHYGLSGSDDWQAFIEAVADREGYSRNQVRFAVVDQQVYLSLELIDSLMQTQTSWVKAPISEDNSSIDEPARVWRVSYANLRTGTPANFEVEGSALDRDVNLLLSGCSDMRLLEGDDSIRRYVCELKGEAGGRSLQVLDNSDGSLLYEAVVSVSAGLNDDVSEAVVSGVSPVKAQRLSTQIFTVAGQNLPLDLGFELAGCQNAQVQSRSSAQLKVQCELDDRSTVRSGKITLGNGVQLYQFNISPVFVSEQAMSVSDVSPAAALEDETIEMLVSGSGFPDSAQIQTTACESVSVLSRTDTQISFSCQQAKLGTWPLYVVTDQQTVIAPNSIQVRSVEATVHSVSPLQAVAGQWLNMQVTGEQLSNNVQLELDACSAIESLDSSSVLRQFGCTPSDAGSFQGKVLAGGRVLYRFDFVVQPESSIRVDSVSPSSSVLGEPLELLFTGTDLPELARVEMDQCANIRLVSASATQLRFGCTPQQEGKLYGKLVDPTAGDLLSFSVDVINPVDPLEHVEVDSVEPGSTYLDQETTFTVSGKHLPTTLALSVEGCTEVMTLGGHDRQRQFRCTPRGSSGLRKVRVYASEGGVVLGSFELQVTGNELRVESVSPKRTAISIETLFIVVGQNLSSAMALDIDGCDARLVSSRSTEQRTYRCTPYGFPGERQIQIRDTLSGAVLFTTTVDITGAP